MSSIPRVLDLRLQNLVITNLDMLGDKVHLFGC